MRLRRMIRSKGHDLLEFRQGWVAAGLPQHPSNKRIKTYLRELRGAKNWHGVTSAKGKAGQLATPSTWARFKKMVSSILRTVTPSRGTRSHGARAAMALALLSASLILPACWEESEPTFEESTDTGCYWVEGEIGYVIYGVEVDDETFRESWGSVEDCVLSSHGE